MFSDDWGRRFVGIPSGNENFIRVRSQNGFELFLSYFPFRKKEMRSFQYELFESKELNIDNLNNNEFAQNFHRELSLVLKFYLKRPTSIDRIEFLQFWWWDVRSFEANDENFNGENFEKFVLVLNSIRNEVFHQVTSLINIRRSINVGRINNVHKIVVHRPRRITVRRIQR